MMIIASRCQDGTRGMSYCLDRPELFFPEGKSWEDLKRTSESKRLCAECPVQPECRAHALAQPERYGIWGGLTRAERGYVGTW